MSWNNIPFLEQLEKGFFFNFSWYEHPMRNTGLTLFLDIQVRMRLDLNVRCQPLWLSVGNGREMEATAVDYVGFRAEHWV